MFQGSNPHCLMCYCLHTKDTCSVALKFCLSCIVEAGSGVTLTVLVSSCAVRFLSLLGPSAGRQQLIAGARSQMYSITLSVAFMALSLLPCAWNALQLLPIAVRKAHEEPAAAALAAGALLLDVLMRFWLLSALMCAINVSVVPVVQRVSQGIIHVLHGVAASLVTRHHAQQR